MKLPISPNITNMLCLIYFICYTVTVSKDFCTASEEVNTESVNLYPTVFIAILSRNKAHTLPYFFAYLERLNYPRDRISLWIRSDHNIDNTVQLLKTWISSHQDKYHSIDFLLDDSSEAFADGNGVFEWSNSHFSHIIHLKETALKAARRMWADYIMFLDSDIFLTNENTLKLLIDEERIIVAPAMETLGAYSNFWCGMTEQGYYKRTDDYLPILEREQIGCFDVPMVHSVVLVDLRKKKSLHLTFDPKKLKGYTGPHDDIIAFASSTKSAGIKMYVSNREHFGYMMAPLERNNTLDDDIEQLANLKAEMLVEEPAVLVSHDIQHFLPKKSFDTIGFDQVYLINLERRPERKARMLNTLNEYGIKAYTLSAIDGQTLNDTYLEQIGVKMLPIYADPYNKRPITKGEIGCFLSHYNIWKDIVHKQHRIALVFEDDLRFEPYFKRKLQSLLKEVQNVGLLWDLIYLGRKRLSEESEPYVKGTSNLVQVDYSYWTLCYLLTLEGAKKLIAADPLPKLVPVDEFLPIMFDRHPQSTWKESFQNRNLRAFSAHPLLVYPTHYTGEENYISDTEDSAIALSVVKESMDKDEL